MKPPPFSYLDTHRVVRQHGNLVHQSSEGSGWLSMFASVQTEVPYEGSFSAIKDHLVVIPLNRPVRFIRRIGGEIQERVLPPGSTTITPGGADFSVQTSSNNGPYDTVHLYIRHELLEEIYTDMFEGMAGLQLPPIIGAMDTLIQSVAVELRKMLVSPDHSDMFYADMLSRTLGGCLVRNHTSGRLRHERPTGSLSPQQLNRAIEYINEYLDAGLSVTRIAKAAGVNTTRLAREFKNNMQLTPYEYVVKARVDRATHLLISTDLPLAEIAMQCGFSHQQHMTRIVHRVAGVTPGSIRHGR